jgi:hypothetical protein
MGKMGTAVGCGVGVRVGEGVGVGVTLGGWVGVAVGVTVGAVVGVKEGVLEGTAVAVAAGTGGRVLTAAGMRSETVGETAASSSPVAVGKGAGAGSVPQAANMPVTKNNITRDFTATDPFIILCPKKPLKPHAVLPEPQTSGTGQIRPGRTPDRSVVRRAAAAAGRAALCH